MTPTTTYSTYTESDALQVQMQGAVEGTSTGLALMAADPLNGWGWVPTNLLDGLLLAGSILYGMNAGIFFIFSVCIMPSLGSISNEGGIKTMQVINDVIQNAWFLAVWGGGFFQGVALLAVLLRRNQRKLSKCIYWKYGLISALCYIGGCTFVTILANVPRNDALAAMDAGSSEAASYWREEYLTKW
eukprot:CAMPEP_0178499204 /NCGR_PEP_ID=MMETSP0696-20121128/15696_1 /TAXON_ID=265572 /ORGANISM="Extubocellulus spinifer, Strain CCMP396" /LENGTH=186 /DNA_ID=CAMNT_0020127879 /DNA_START=273 /DNA_END=830 /DNA_ORIENTATION=+